MGVLWWIPYNSSQALAYAVVYGFLATVVGACLGLLGLTRRRPSSTHVRPQPSEASGVPPASSVATNTFVVSTAASLRTALDETATAAPCDVDSGGVEASLPPRCHEEGYSLRLGVLLVCALIRFAGQAAICASCVSGAEPVPSLTEMLFLAVAFEDGQGMLTLLLFGLQPQNVQTICMRLRLAWVSVSQLSPLSPLTRSRSWRGLAAAEQEAEHARRSEQERLIAIWRA